MGGHLLDTDGWVRESIHAFFLGFDDPIFELTTELDAAPTRAWCRAHDAPLHWALWWAVLRAASGVEALRMRRRPGGAVWVHDALRLGTTALRSSGDFAYVYTDDAPTFGDYLAGAQARWAEVEASTGLHLDEADDLIHGTVIPWVRFTSIKHARARVDRVDSIPKVALGRATPDGARLALPVSLQADHALVDGVHAGAFFEALQAHLADPEGTLGA